MKINRMTTIVFVLVGLLVGGLSVGIFLSQRSLSEGVSPSAQEGKASDDSGDVEDDDADDTDEADVRPDQAGITAEAAREAAESGNPGTKALEVELEDEKGTLVYEVELDNGLEVIVDAANGNILRTERDEED
jgi:uncharacterized membrane protein YkoI